jgi:glucose/arabinose dehydrogenase
VTLRVLLTAVVVAIAVAVGCGGDDGSAAPTEAAPDEAAPAASPARGAPARPAGARGVRLRRIGRFASPTYVTAPRADRSRLFVVERAGTIRLIRDGRRLSRPFLDIRGSVSTGGERGLLSMAFARDYASSGRFYVYFTDNRGDIRIQEYARSGGDPDVAAGGSARNVLTVGHRRFANHNGGQLQVGPDGMLWIGTGDGGGGGDPFGSGQDRGTLLGKLLRIDPRPGGGRSYRIPRNNPFRGRSGARPEIWAYGLRNPWRFSFDRRTGALNIADVGQGAQEEVNFRRRRGRGANYGWNVFEGRRRYRSGRAPGHVRPVLVQSHSNGSCSITGGYVVRDRRLSGLFGRYVYGDLCRSRLRSAVLRRGRARGDRPMRVSVGSLVSFGEDAAGRVYAVSINGPVYRLDPR